MIPNLVTHVKTELNSGIKAILSDRYIINVVLEDLEDDVKSSFIARYADIFDDTGARIKDGQGIPILTNYPEDIQSTNTFILVGLGSGKESNDNLGMSGGGYINDNLQTVKETGASIFRIDNTTLGVHIKNEPDINTISIPNFTASDITYNSGGYLVISNISPELLGGINYDTDTLQVNYDPLVKKDSPAMGYGFVVEESATVLIVSNSLDDIRAIDSILKAVIIIMRKKEFSKYNLGNFSVQPPLPLEDYAPGTPKITFGREVDLEYKVDYLLDSNNKQVINKIILSLDNISK